MDPIPIVVKHQGKKYNVDLDPTANGEILKFQLFSLTGVEPDRQSVLIKGGKLKDDTDLSKLNAKPGQIFTMLGTASSEGSALVAPPEKPKFVEDMTEAEAAAQEGATPAGLQNLGNTCYLNSTLQVLRSIPEMQQELRIYKPGPAADSSLQSLSQYGLGGLGQTNDLTAQLRDLYKQMSETQEGIPPIMFLTALRNVFPQFAQKAKNGQGFAQQDAEEAWSQIVQQLRQRLKITDKAADDQNRATFVDRFLAGSFHSSLAPPPDANDEPVVESDDSFLKLDCHIDSTVNHLKDGLMAGLTEEIEKNSPSLGRDAVYTKTSRISRLPKYLTVHFVRFFWRKDIQKKTKVLRKVTFPDELDIVEYCTEDLRKRLIPVRDKIREIRKDEQDVERARKRQKLARKQEEDRNHDAKVAAPEAAPIAKLREQQEKKESKGKEPEGGGEMDVYKTDAEYEAERAASIKQAKKELFQIIDPELATDEGANKSGLYELCGVITHQGASADSGHYTSFVKKQGKLVDDPKAPGGKRKEEDGKWWWFNDDKVSEVDSERIMTLAGGGESASALILLYRAIDLPTKDEIEESS